jgi:hypothetical protein
MFVIRYCMLDIRFVYMEGGGTHLLSNFLELSPFDVLFIVMAGFIIFVCCVCFLALFFYGTITFPATVILYSSEL